MKKLIVFASVLFLTMIIAAYAFAGGGKVRGDNGLGEVNQVQVQDPPPFN